MKRITSVLVMLAVLSVEVSFAQHCQVTRNDYEQVDLTFSTSALKVTTVQFADGMYSLITMDEYFQSTQVGKPQLPVMVKMLEIPICDSVVATVKNAQYEEVDAADLGVRYPVIPAQPSYSKSYSGEVLFAKDENTYSTDTFYSEPIVRVEKNGVMRDVCLASVYVAPISYNPVTRKFRVCRKVEVEISFVNADIPGTCELKSKYGSPVFQEASKMVVNASNTRDEFSNTMLKYLIIAHSTFENNADIQSFVEWKKKMGYLVELVYTSNPNVGTTTTSIKNYIQSQYDNATNFNPAPTFILLIGDVGQIPSFPSTEENTHVTDLYYACLSLNDYIPDCYYGRFSASTVSQLTPQIEKSLMYEQYTMPDPSYLGKAVLVAGTDARWSPTHANGQMNYVNGNYIKENSTTHNYTTVYTHLYNSSSQESIIRNEIGSGVGWTNYSAHGSTTGWADPSFSNSHVPAMNNENKYGIMIGNCCLTGKFNDGTCFGESLLRASKKGAVAYIGASEVSYWDEDAYWAVGVRNEIQSNMSYDASHLGAYDRIFHTHNESSSVTCSTLGGFVMGGNLSVQSSTSYLKKYYWEIYHIFGDPSLRPYLGMPSQMTVVAPDVITINTQSINISAAPYAYVALTKNNVLISSAFTNSSGQVILALRDNMTPGEYEIAISAQNHIPYFQTLSIVSPRGAYVVASSSTNIDEPLPGTDMRCNVSLSNVGSHSATNLCMKLVPLESGFTVSPAQVRCSDLAPDASVDVTNAFSIRIPQFIKDQTEAKFRLITSWDGDSSVKNISIKVKASKLRMESYQTISAQNTSEIFSGDDFTMEFVSKNLGHYPARNAIVDLTCNYSGVVVTSAAHRVLWLDVAQTVTDSFNLHVSDDVPSGSIVPLYFHIVCENEYLVDTVYVTVGRVVEPFETGDFSQFQWVQNHYPWSVVTQNPYEGSYCARSKDNLGKNVSSVMQITFNSAISGELSFFRKISSEEGYDMLHVYIDGEDRYQTSGEGGWAQVTLPMDAGQHTVKFSYEKDGSQAYGYDCAWIDNIVFPGMGSLVEEDTHDVVNVENHISKEEASVYPNPTKNKVVVAMGQQIQSVMLYDVFGKVLKVVPACDLSVALDLSAYPAGLYLIRVISENQSVSTHKIIKQ